ncbi:MAG: hypothetical protein OQL09_04000 [Gammaproteobacteria bacterium]|nr:hypothetical protein [Gammaproteobacteria bacterium]
MSEHPTDSSLEQDIEKRYRSLSTEQPPAYLDRQILQAAHRALNQKTTNEVSNRNIWLRSLAYAAVLVVGVSVVIEVSMQPEMMPTEPALMIEDGMAPLSKEVLPEAGRSVSKASADQSAESEESFQPDRQRARKTEMKARQNVSPMASESRSSPPPSPAKVQSLEMVTPASEPMMSEQDSLQTLLTKPWRASPQLWLLQCQRLLEENRTDELAIELAEFRRQHGAYPIPQDLLDWLPQTSPSANP